MLIKKAEFRISVSDADKILHDNLPEIAIAGKSNVGKSSFINFICNNGKLSRTSADPGRTRLINYFLINDSFYFVDLPGYGYAKVSKSEKKKWGDMIEGYLVSSENLVNVFVLVDIRHEPSEDDMMLINFLNFHNIPFTVIATKDDKLSNNQRRQALTVVARGLKVGVDNVIPISSLNKTGGDKVLQRLEQVLSD